MSSRWLFLNYLLFHLLWFWLGLYFHLWPFCNHSEWIIVHPRARTRIPTTSISSIIHFTLVVKLQFWLKFRVSLLALWLISRSICPHRWPAPSWRLWYLGGGFRVFISVLGLGIIRYRHRILGHWFFQKSSIIYVNCIEGVFQFKITFWSLRRLIVLVFDQIKV
jgi:hypothetical protein